MALWGYIDESYATGGNGLFTLACIFTEGSTWSWFELAWQNCLDKKNAELSKQGRKQLSRYHASDCSSRVGEFKGWSTDEQIDFTQSLMRVFLDLPVNTIAYTVDLKELTLEIPDPDPDAMGFAYGLLLNYLMLEMCGFVGGSSRYRSAQISLRLFSRICG
jgi:hypothetical protein